MVVASNWADENLISSSFASSSSIDNNVVSLSAMVCMTRSYLEPFLIVPMLGSMLPYANSAKQAYQRRQDDIYFHNVELAKNLQIAEEANRKTDENSICIVGLIRD